MTMKRRDALKTLGAIAGTAGMAKILPGCGGGDGGETGITTVVVLMMENRSYDHWLGYRSLLEGKPGDGLRPGLSNPDLDGTLIEPYPGTFDSLCVLDPPHGWNAFDVQFGAGQMDGFVVAHQQSHGSPSAVEPMQYVTPDLIPATAALADAYTICDRWFCSVRGPTWPNRMYWHSGQSAGIMSNDFPAQGFDWASIYHRLDAVGVEWAYYYGDIAVISVLENYDLAGRVKRFDDFLLDAAAGRLPPVVYIDPAFSGNDDHPPKHPLLGQALISSIYNALAMSPQWKNCLFVVTYDESGGFYDHVPPPETADDFAATGFSRLGFRVPTIVAGPYAKQAHVSSVVYDHTSVLKHFEVKHGLAPLTMRSTAANDILDCIDLDRLAAGDPADPIDVPPIEIDYAMIEEACQGSFKTADPHPVLAAADARPDLFGRYDRRAHVVEYLEMIGAYLDKHGLGRLAGKKRY